MPKGAIGKERKGLDMKNPCQYKTNANASKKTSPKKK